MIEMMVQTGAITCSKLVTSSTQRNQHPMPFLFKLETVMASYFSCSWQNLTSRFVKITDYWLWHSLSVCI